MAKLIMAAQMLSDLYYQNYRADDQFFELEHFKFLIVSEYTNQVNQEAKANKRENKIFSGFTYIEVSSDWLKTIKVEVKKEDNQWVAPIPQPIFPFDFDAIGSAVQFVEVVKCGKTEGPCGELIRIPKNDKWMACAMPPNAKLYYYVANNSIYFINVKCDLKEVEISYVPAPECMDDDFEIHDDKVHTIIRAVLNTFFGSKNGNLVDMSNDSNPNTIPQKEVGI